MTTGADFNVKGNADELTRNLTAAFEQLGNRLDKILGATLRKIEKNFGEAFNSNDALRANQRLLRSFETLEATINSINRSTDGFVNSIENLDPGAVAGLSNQLSKIAVLQDKLDLGPEVLGVEGYKAVSLELRAVSAGLVAVRETALAAGRAQDEANRNIARDQRQVSREFIQSSKEQTSRYVVDQQTQAAAARDAARKRIAFVQAAARTIATIERGLSNIFRQTARVFSSAFRSAATAVTGVASGIGRAFSRTTTNIRNSVTNSNSEVSRSYRKTFGDTTNTVQNETRKQQSIINNFAREASSSIGGIRSGVGVGIGAAIGGILGVGAAKALTGGFTRATTIENAERALTKLTGEAEKAEFLLSEIDRVVTGTPFKFDQFAAGATQLLAFNVEAEKIPDVLETVANASSLSLDSNLTAERLIRTFGQIQTAGKVTTEDLNQLAEAGVSGFDILGNALGVTIEELRDLISDGAVPATEAIDILVDGINNGTDGVNGATKAFGGLAQELGGTLKGSVTNLGTAFDRAGANVIKTFTPALVAAAQAARRAIDIIGFAFQALAQSVVDSPVFGLFQRGLDQLVVVLTKAGVVLKPVFALIADGVVLLAQFAGALAVFRRFPAVLRLVGVAATRIFTPFNLLVGAGVLVAGAFQRVLKASPDLKTAFENLLPPLRRIFTVVKDLATDVFDAFAVVLDEVITPAVGFLADRVADFLIPVLNSLATFLEEKVLPPIRRFAKFIRTDVIPFIGTAFAKGVEIGKAALEGIVNFIKGTVIPIFREFVRFVQVAFDVIVRGGTAGGLQAGGDGWLAYNGPITQGLFRIRQLLGEVAEFFRASVTILWRGDEYTEGTGWLSDDGLVIRGLNNIRAAMESVVNFTRDNFLPVLAGVGAAAGVFALSGSIPIAGLAGITTGIVAALSNDDIRNALVDTVTKAVTAARDVLTNFVDSGTLGDIALNVLKVANKVGEILGDIVSDRRLVAAVGAIAAFAVALAGSFLLGFAEGIAKNLPELVDLLTDTLRKAATEAVKAIVSDPALGLLLVGLFAGPLLLRRLGAAGRASGAIIADGMKQGATKNLGATGGNTANQFVKSLVGGPSAIRAAAAQSGDLYARTFSRRITQSNELSKALTGGAIKGLRQSNQGGFGPITGDPRNLRIAERSTQRLIAEYGKGAVAATNFRLGLKNLGQGLRNIRTSTDQARLGAAQLRSTFQLVGREIGIVAGVAAGAAFVGAFGASAAFETGADTSAVVSGVGSAAVAGLSASLVAGGPLTPTGAGVGLAVAGVSLLGGAFLASKKNAEAFDESVKNLAKSLKDLSGEEFNDNIAETVLNRLRDSSDGAREALLSLGITAEDFTDALLEGRAVEFVAEQFDALGPQGKIFADALRDGEVTLGRIDDTIRGSGGSSFVEGLQLAELQSEIKDTGLSVDDFAGAFSFAGETIKFVQSTFDELNLQRREEGVRTFGQAFLGAAANVQTLDGNIALYSAELAISGAASDAFKTKLNELNEARLDSARTNLENVKQRLNDARDAAGEARDALIDYLNGDYSVEGLQGVTDQAVIDVGSTTRALADLPENLTPDEVIARTNQLVSDAANNASTVLATGLAELGADFTPEEAAKRLQPLFDTAGTIGGEAGQRVIDAILGVLVASTTDDGQRFSDAFVQSNKTVTGIESSESRAEQFLANALKIDPTTLQPLVDEASAFAQGVAENVASGYVASINEDTTAGTATQEWAQAAIAAATGPLAFDTDSPSKAFEKIGGFVVEGFVNGITNNIELIETVGTEMKTALLAGLDPEGDGEFLAFLDAGRDAGYAFGDGSAIEEVYASVTDRGVQLAEQMLLGISESGEHLLFLDYGRDAGYAFGDGTAEQGVKSSLEDRGRQMVTQALLGISESGEHLRFLDAGFNAGNAFARGLGNSIAIVAAAARSVAAAAAAAVEAELEIDSPSKVFEGLGRFTMEGFAEGINSSAGLVADAAGSAVKGAVDASIAQAGGVTIGVDAGVTSAAFSLANQQASISATGGGSSMMSISSGDISNLARAIATESKPNVNIEQTFTEPVDSRAVAADVAWRLT